MITAQSNPFTQYFSFYSLLLLLCVSNGCSKHDAGPAATETLFIAGEGSSSTACYWKDNLLTQLSSDLGQSRAYRIALNGNDVYAVGFEIPMGQTFNAVFWKNGQKTQLYSDYSKPSIAYDISFDQGSVYIAGTMPVLDNFSNQYYSRVVYWKDGVPVVLAYGNAVGIAVSAGDVYVAGQTSNGPYYWKNGTAQVLQNANGNVMAMALANGLVYTSGMAYVGQSSGGQALSSAVYWTNDGVIHPLTDGTTMAMAPAITVSGNDVYVAGQEAQPAIEPAYVLKYWKNGQPIVISATPTVESELTGITVYKGDVYCVGRLNGQAAYWKNGVIHSLSQTTNTGNILVIPK